MGFAPGAAQCGKECVISLPTMTDSTRYSAFRDDALGTHDATSLCQMLERREVSPLELTEAAIARAEQASQLGAIAYPTFDEARARAARQGTKNDVMPMGYMGGLPSFLKDNVELSGAPARFGSNAMPRKPHVTSCVLADHYLAAGLNFLGKSAMPPFGFCCSTEFSDGTPPTRNPWHLDYTAGGSSGGAASLVAAGVVPIAHANDGGGSIRIPAAMCGLVGLKPTRGRLVLRPVSQRMPVDIFSDGVLTRSVRDSARFFHAIENVYRAPRLPSIGLVEGPAKTRLRIGVYYDSLLTRACPQTRQAIRDTADALENAGHRLEEMPIPLDQQFADDFTLYWGFLAFTIDAFGRQSFGRDFNPEGIDPFTLGLSRQFRRGFWRLPRALRRLRRAQTSIVARNNGFDAVLSPVIAQMTPKLGAMNPGLPFSELFSRLESFVGYTPLDNATGNPAIAVPAGLSNEGLPIGIQLASTVGMERRLLELAFELEALRPWPHLFATPSQIDDKNRGGIEAQRRL